MPPHPLRPAAWLLGALLSFGLAATSQADSHDVSAQREVIAGGCANCHGTDGRGADRLTPLAGRPAEALEAILLAFKRDEVEGTTIMNRIAKGFSDEEIAALAQHFADIDAP